MSSNLKKYDKEIDYKFCTRGEDVYDQYQITLQGFGLIMLEDLTDYRRCHEAKTLRAMNELTLQLKISRCLDPKHPVFPTMEVFLSIEDIELYVSDHILAGIMRVKNKVLKAEEEVTPESDSDDEPEEAPDEGGEHYED